VILKNQEVQIQKILIYFRYPWSYEVKNFN